MTTDLKINELQAASYIDLLTAFQPHAIRTEADYKQVQAMVDHLIDQGELSPAEEEYLDLLGELIWSYEDRTEDKSQYMLVGIALIKGLMENQELQQKDLIPIFKTKSIVSAVLNGKRRLTVAHIDGLAEFFRMPHSLFFEPNHRSVAR